MLKLNYLVTGILLSTTLSSQSYIGPASSTVSAGEYNISYSVGEAIIGYNSDGSYSALTGMQQPLYENMFGLPSLTYSTISANPNQIDADGTVIFPLLATIRN